MKIIGSIQARFSSTRLPGKVLKDICGKPMLLWQIERLKKSKLLDEIVVATTLSPFDDEVVKFCKKNRVSYFRGSEVDVLNRIASLIRSSKADVHVEFFGDSPLVDVDIVDEVIKFYLKNKDKYDFVCNCLKTTYPPGQEVMVYRGSALLEADEFVAKNDPLREHVNIHITGNGDRFKIFNFEAPKCYHYPEIYLEVDTPDDFKLIENIITHFSSKGQEYFSLREILDYLNHNKKLISLNNKVQRRWKKFRKD